VSGSSSSRTGWYCIVFHFFPREENTYLIKAANNPCQPREQGRVCRVVQSSQGTSLQRRHPCSCNQERCWQIWWVNSLSCHEVEPEVQLVLSKGKNLKSILRTAAMPVARGIQPIRYNHYLLQVRLYGFLYYVVMKLLFDFLRVGWVTVMREKLVQGHCCIGSSMLQSGSIGSLSVQSSESWGLLILEIGEQ
jgi:hypothetical protein